MSAALARLIAEQARDARVGDRVHSISLDAMGDGRRHRVVTRIVATRPQLEAHARRAWWLSEAARCASVGAEGLARACRSAALRDPHSEPGPRYRDVCGDRAPAGFGEGCALPIDHPGFHHANIGVGSQAWPRAPHSQSVPRP